jgi:hypothetical protein
MKEEIYRVYKSHTRTDGSTDRPSLEKTPFEAVIWFTKRHGYHLIPKLFLIGGLPFIVMYGMRLLPGLLDGVVHVDSTVPAMVTPPVQVLPHPSVADFVTETVDTAALMACRESSEAKDAELSAVREEMAAVRAESEDIARKLTELEARRASDYEITGLFPWGVITKDNRRRYVGDFVLIDGVEQRITAVDVVRAAVRFESGRIIVF